MWITSPNRSVPMTRHLQFNKPTYNMKSQVFLLASMQLSCLATVAWALDRTINLKMPEVRANHDEAYLCVSKRLNPSASEFVVAFEPDASATRVHHILIYGCALPGKVERDTPDYVWDCGEMASESGNIESPYDKGSICAPGAKQTILFGWALDAPAISLPPGVGFKIGGDSGFNYLVLQVHYASAKAFLADPEMTDSSGIILHTKSGKNTGINKLAGIYLLASYGYVTEGHSNHSMECIMQEDKVLHPFRFRTHTHKLGVKVAGYRVPAEDSSNMILIGEHDPQKPQMFYQVEDSGLTVRKGDHVYAYCEYNNTRGRTIYIGATGNDEMCNFYMMYWIEGNDLLANQECIQYNPH